MTLKPNPKTLKINRGGLLEPRVHLAAEAFGLPELAPCLGQETVESVPLLKKEKRYSKSHPFFMLGRIRRIRAVFKGS